MKNTGDWWKNNRYTLRHKVRLLFGVHGSIIYAGTNKQEYFFDNPPSWKYPKLNKFLNRLINLVPKW